MDYLKFKYGSIVPNQSHRLLVTVSKHLRISAADSDHLIYQQKPFTTPLPKVANANHEHVVHFILQDVDTAMMYGEVHPGYDLPKIEDFLQRGWMWKGEFVLFGLPEFLICPQIVCDFYPQLLPILRDWNVNFDFPKSGFDAGIRIIKTWEETIEWNNLERKIPFTAIQETTSLMSKVVNLQGEKSRLFKEYYSKSSQYKTPSHWSWGDYPASQITPGTNHS